MFDGASNAYLQFVLDYAPYFYYVPGSGAVGERGVAAATFAIDFLFEAYSDSRFAAKRNEIYSKIVSLADWILTQQCVDDAKQAFGGFKSNEASDYYYAIDACRVIPSLLRAYSLTKNLDYLNSARLAGFTFLKNMQDRQNYGGFARAVTIDGDWLLQLDVECLYGILGLKMLAETYDTDNANTYQGMMVKLVDFLRSGFENLWLYYDPADNAWHRAGVDESQIYDDCFAYALLGFYNYEGWSSTVQRVYETLNAIGPSGDYAGYNPNLCWAGYIDVARRKAACAYYDSVTCGILHDIRAAKDKPSLEFGVQVLDRHYRDFMFWGVKFKDLSPVENKQSIITVSWLGLLLLRYMPKHTPFKAILEKYGENLTLYPILEVGETVSYGEGIPFKAMVRVETPTEIVLEPGYTITDYITLQTFLPIRTRDKVRRGGVDFEVGPVKVYRWMGEPAYYQATCRRLIIQ
ncbi:MAG: hypothetical protein QHH17_01820 [Candidatus Bathyarchaeota archaeon]|jgi:hypothetical protein|nr:hypothetical protein [Candidatus Bathyarchaeota archaeon]